MSRIDVIPVREVKGGYKILVNYIQFGVIYHSSKLANQEAQKLKDTHYPKAEVSLVEEK